VPEEALAHCFACRWGSNDVRTSVADRGSHPLLLRLSLSTSDSRRCNYPQLQHLRAEKNKAYKTKPPKTESPQAQLKETHRSKEGEPPSSSPQPPRIPPSNEDSQSSDIPRKSTCQVFLEDFILFFLVTLACGYNYCSPCVTGIFKVATKDGPLYPPRCCKKPIPVATGLLIVHWEVIDDALEEKIDWEVVDNDRLHCSKRDCAVLRNLFGGSIMFFFSE
jgi:hypothetical protein